MSLRKWAIRRIELESKVIAAWQSRTNNSVVLALSSIASLLGQHYAYLAICPALFWMSRGNDILNDPFQRYSLSIVGVIGFSNFMSGVYKDIAALPRPFSPPVLRYVQIKSVAQEYGFPSTHTANAMGFALFTSLVLNTPKATIVLFSYAIIVSLSRLVRGMHSFLDVFGGIMIGLSVGLAFHYIMPILFDMLAMPTILVPLGLTIASFIVLYMHPHPPGPCPCYEDSHCFVAAFTGASLGIWLRIHHISLIPSLYDAVTESHHPLILWKRLLLGVPIILSWRSIAKKPTALFFSLVSLKQDSNAKPLPYRLDKWSPLMLSRWVVYIGIGVFAADLCPLLFDRIGI